MKEIKSFLIEDCGCCDYLEAYARQKEHVDQVIQGASGVMMLCEHPSVLTLGRMADEQHILWSRRELQAKGVQVLPIDRGGEVTLHSPGQLVIYPILDLRQYKKDLKYYLYKLEEVGIDFLKRFDIEAARVPGKTGVWVGKEKIASIGIGVRKWVSFHGMALNINTDLTLYKMIRPCGLDVGMTSMQKIVGRDVEMASAKNIFVEVFQRHF